MNQLETSTMALTLEREHRLRPARLERERRIDEHLGAAQSLPAGALKLAWYEAVGVLRGRWQWLALPGAEPAPPWHRGYHGPRLTPNRKEPPMSRLSIPARLALVALAALLALPTAPIADSVAAKNRSRTVTKTVRNTAAIILTTDEVDTPVSANRYPSAIEISGMKGRIRDVNLRLTNFTHTYPDEVQMLLVGPDGQIAQVMGNVGGSHDVFALTLRLDDEAATLLPNDGELDSGSFRPTAAPGSTDVFNTPAPLPSGNSALTAFDGSNPNGTWRLFVQDEYGPTDPGAFASGWALEITTKAKKRKN